MENWLSARHDSWTIEGHTVGYDDAWVDFSWPRPRDSLDGHLGRGAMMEGTRDDDDMVG